ncbi:hypothetical protein LCGC14_1778730 [marine sediment metagenome]|uniref:Uncharacterized protein n=1 Tax=marine sediment metagenome TaxID=412755 RepID=A0A0F9JAZ2_9ZZZZ
MNWTVIGLLITLIVILFGSISIAVYSIFRLVDNAKMLMHNLNYYQELANKYGLQLTRIRELVKEYETYSRGNWSGEVVRKLIISIKTLTKLAGEK